MSPHGLAYTVFLGALSALPPLSIDMGLPGVPLIEASLAGAAGRGALTLSLFLAGFALSPLLCGPLADRFGRRSVTAAGLFAFTIAATACVMARSFPLLLACRLVQGVAAGACVIMPLAIVRDVFDGATSRHHLSRITAVVGLAPMLAPVLGSWVMAIGGWRAIYAAQATCGLVLLVTTLLLFEETLPGSARRPLKPAAVMSAYAHIVRDRGFRGNALVYGFAFAVMFSYISSAPAVLMGQMRLSPATFGMVFAVSSCGTMLGSLLSGRLNARGVNGRSVVNAGVTGLVAASLAIMAMTLAGAAHVLTIVPAVAVTIFCFGLLGPSASNDALANLASVAGSASGLLRCTQMLLGACASALVARFSPLGQPMLILAGLMMVTSVSSAACLLRLRTAERSAGLTPTSAKWE